MPTTTYAGASVEITDDGFLVDKSHWTPAIAEAIAAEVNISPLTDKHWQVLNFCREDDVKEGQPPGLRRISKLSGVNMKELYALFPKGPGKLASRIAGLPKPHGCI